MASYTEYTKTAVKDLCLVFRCTHCGFTTAFRQPFGKSISYTANSRTSATELKWQREETNAELNKWQESLLQETRRAVYEQKILPQEAYVCCPKCEKVPAWIYHAPFWMHMLPRIGYTLLVIAVIVLAASILNFSPSTLWGIWVSIIIAALSLPGFLLCAAYKNKKLKDALKTDRKDLPIICGSVEDAQEILAALEDQNNQSTLEEALKKQNNPYSGAAKSMLTLQFASGVKKAVVYFAGDEFKITKTTEQVYPVIANSYLIVKANNCEDSEQILIKAKKDTVIEVFCTKTDTYLKVLSQKTAEQYL